MCSGCTETGTETPVTRWLRIGSSFLPNRFCEIFHKFYKKICFKTQKRLKSEHGNQEVISDLEVLYMIENILSGGTCSHV